MKAPYFNVRAICDITRCKTSVFEVQRKKVHSTGTSGQKQQIENLVCPGCRMWAKITKIEEVTE